MANNLDILAQSVNKYVVTPINAFGLGGFDFDVEGESTVNLTSEITDHYLEDNTTVQDHIAVRPKKITLKSYVGELVFNNDDQADEFVQKVTRKLTVLNDALPLLSDGAGQVLSAIKEDRLSDISLDNISLEGVNKSLDYWAFVKNMVTNTSRQQQAYMYLKALQEGKFLVSVQTPFEFMTNMAIESVVGIQPEDSRFVTDFTITLKQIRTVALLNVEGNSGSYTSENEDPNDLFQGRAASQNQDLENVGNVEGLSYPADLSDPAAAWRAARDRQALLIGNNPFSRE